MHYPISFAYDVEFRDGRHDTLYVTWYANDRPGPSIPEQLGPEAYANVARMTERGPGIEWTKSRVIRLNYLCTKAYRVAMKALNVWRDNMTHANYVRSDHKLARHSRLACLYLAATK